MVKNTLKTLISLRFYAYLLLAIPSVFIFSGQYLWILFLAIIFDGVVVKVSESEIKGRLRRYKLENRLREIAEICNRVERSWLHTRDFKSNISILLAVSHKER